MNTFMLLFCCASKKEEITYVFSLFKYENVTTTIYIKMICDNEQDNKSSLLHAVRSFPPDIENFSPYQRLK